MASLQEVWEEVASHALELEEERINGLDYWLARCNIDQDEFFEWQAGAVGALLPQPEFTRMNPSEKVAAIATLGFIAGLVYGMRRMEDELESNT